MVIKYLVTFLCVIVTGPPSAICFLNNGITDPEEFITFPKRTIQNLVCFEDASMNDEGMAETK